MKMTQKVLLLLLALAPFTLGTAFAVSTSYWTQNSQEDFQAGEAENVSISSRGTVALSGKVSDIEGLEEDFVWCMVRDSAGNTYVGTGGEGAIYKVSPGGSASLLVKLDEPNVTAMVASPLGGIYAAGSPEAKVYKISSRGDKELVCDLEETYVWSMAVSKDGTLFIATGDEGKIYRVKRGDDPEVLYDSPESHILALIRDDEGNLYAGTHPNALIYRIDSAGKPFVLFDADEDEIHALALGPDGSVFAATASGGRASLPSGSMQGGPAPPIGEVMLGGTDFPSADVAAGPSAKNAGKNGGPPGPPRPSGTNSIYKVLPDGSVEKLFSGRNVLLYALAVAPDRSILAAAASPGRIYRVLEKDRIVRLHQTDEAQVLSLLVEPDGDILFGTGNQGRLRRLGKTPSKTGTLTSEPLDAAMLSRWGNITWTVDLPENTSIGFSTRSGNSAEPDDTWSEWSEEMTEPGSEIQSPPARFLQYKADLSTRNGRSSPIIREVTVAYQTFNRPPEVLSVGAQAASNGPRKSNSSQSSQQSKTPPGSVQIKWKPNDPNGDSLEFALYYRHVDEEAWKLLEEDLEKPSYTWDTLSVPDGDYRIRVVASDSPSNPEGQSLEGEKISDPITVDNTRPEISGLQPIKKRRGGWSVPGRAHDKTSPITGIEYSLDGGDWTALPAIDGILDSKEEFFSIEIEALDPGRHSVVVRAEDIRGNIGASRVMIEAQ